MTAEPRKIDLPRRKRSPFSTIGAIFLVAIAMVVLLVMRVNSIFRKKYVPIGELQFPVLVIQPGGAPVFAEWDAWHLQSFSENSLRTPVDGTVLIDSAFNQFTQRNVSRKKEGELKWIARALIPGLSVKYTFDLERSKASGAEAAMELIRRAPAFAEEVGEDSAIRSAAAKQTTMAGLLDALGLFKPPDPVTQPTEAERSVPATGEPEPVVKEQSK